MTAKPSLACVQDYAEFARTYLPKPAHDYYASGADGQVTLSENRQAFTRFRIMPKMLVDVSSQDLSTTVLGHRVAFPILVAPSAMQRMAHPDGELATARAAAAAGTGMVLSSWSTTSLEDVAEANGNGLRWFQLYVYKDREVVKQLVRRAEKAGYSAIALTVDAPFLGKRLADVRNRFKLPAHLRLANFDSASSKATGVQSSSDSGLAEYVASQESAMSAVLHSKTSPELLNLATLIDSSLSWKDVAWLKSITSLPIVVKGVLTAEDAIRSVEAGAAGILVSNHGARQLDGAPATIEVLSEIVDAVKGRVEVYLDGGVTQGTDALKAIALGARAVFVGRPILWGLSYDGEHGVRGVLEILRNEFKMAMALSGCVKVSELHPGMIRPVDSFYKSKL